MQSGALDAHLQYWEQRLTGAPATLDLPFDRPRPAAQSHRGATLAFRMPADRADAVKALGRREGATPAMVLLAAFKTLLHRYTGVTDIVVGSPIANRGRVELENVVGFFINTQVLRTDLSGEPTFRETLARVRATCLEAYEHEEVPFDEVVKRLKPVRDPSHNPLFQIMFQFRDAGADIETIGGMAARGFPHKNVTAKFDLLLSVEDTHRGLSGYLEYSTDVFDRPTVERFYGHFESLLGRVLSDPDQRIGAVPLLSAAERATMLEDWNATTAALPAAASVSALFEAQARRTPEAPAVVFEETTVSYGELDRRANELARHLRGLGVGRGVRVGLCVERSPDMVVGLLGIMKAGGAYVPLDPDFPAGRLAFMLEDSQAPVLVAHAALTGFVPADSTARIVCLDREREAIFRGAAEAPADGAGGDDAAYVIYTSGSTGKPKGVMVLQRTW